MTKRPLPETDLANIATLPKEQQKSRLKLKKDFRPPFSLSHVRRNQGMLLGVAEKLSFATQSVPDQKLLSALKNCCRSDVEAAANLRRAEALIGFRKASLGGAREEYFRSFPLSIDTRIRLAEPLVLLINGKAYIPSCDLRKSGRLTARGRSFVFSMNYHLIIDAEEDFRDAGLVLLDYWEETNQHFGITPHFFTGTPDYSFEELSAMMRFTYDLWQEVLEEEREANHKGNAELPLFGTRRG